MATAQFVEIQCPVCNSAHYRDRYIVDQHLHYVRCLGCGLVYLNPRYSDEALRRVYEDFDVPFVKRWRESLGQGAAPGTAEYQQLVDRCLPYERLKLGLLERMAQEKSVLDVGFGAGLFLAAAQRLGWDAAGVELQQPPCDFLAAMLGIRAYCGELPEVDLQGRMFGCVTLIDTLEHVTRPREYLAAAYRLLKPGGVLFVSVPNIDSVAIRLRRDRARMLAVHTHHLWMFSAATLKRMLEEAGFTRVARVPPSQCKPQRGIKRVMEHASFLLLAENTMRATARKPG